jgi:hypothetical protein
MVGSNECLPCKRGFKMDQEGATACDICPFNHDSFEGSKECFPCAFLDYHCRSFWRHVLQVLILTLMTIVISIRYIKQLFGSYGSTTIVGETKWAAGIRSEGRRFGYVYYQPMSIISTETILGGTQISSTKYSMQNLPS